MDRAGLKSQRKRCWCCSSKSARDLTSSCLPGPLSSLSGWCESLDFYNCLLTNSVLTGTEGLGVFLRYIVSVSESITFAGSKAVEDAVINSSYVSNKSRRESHIDRQRLLDRGLGLSSVVGEKKVTFLSSLGIKKSQVW